MSHRPDSVAPGLHPVCAACAALPLVGMPCPPTGEHVAVRAGRYAIASVPHFVHRYQGADVEGCCWCGLITDQGYYVVDSDVRYYADGFECRTECRNVAIWPLPLWKKAWRLVVRSLR